MLKTAVITVSDRAAAGVYTDRSGPVICGLLQEAFPDMQVSPVIVPDEEPALRSALEAHADRDWIITTGGTGIGPRDITPDVSAAFCERALPGISEMLRAASLQETPMAALSRGYAGLRHHTIVVNFPGSVRAVDLCTRLIIPIMLHARDMLAGKGHT